MTGLTRPSSAPLLALLMISCATSRYAFHAPRLTVEEILDRVQARNASIHSLEAEGSLTIETSLQSGTVNFDLQLKQPDTLWMRFSGPFGVSLGTLMLSRDRFVLYDPRERRIVSGLPTPERLEQVFNIRLSFDDIVNAITGSLGSIERDDQVTLETVAEQRYYVLRSATSGTKVWIDGESFVASKIVLFDEDNRVALSGISTRLERVNGIYMPYLVRVVLPAKQQSATVAYSDVAINGELEKEFSLPHDTEVRVE